MKRNNLHDLNGERKNQLLVLVDKKGRNLGLATREECHKGNGKTHLAFMAFVLDKDKKIILTKRAKRKSLWGGYWDVSVVSHVLPGETIEEAAERRGREELGIEVDFTNLGAFYYFEKFGEASENEYCHVLVGKSSQEIEFNPVEIEEIKKISVTELKQEIKDNQEIFTPWLKIALNKINFDKIDHVG